MLVYNLKLLVLRDRVKSKKTSKIYDNTIITYFTYLGLIKDTKIINPIICHTLRAGFATLNSSTTTEFHKSFPTNPRITIAIKKDNKKARKSTYALRRSLESEAPANPSIAALHAELNPILYSITLFQTSVYGRIMYYSFSYTRLSLGLASRCSLINLIASAAAVSDFIC